MLKICAPTVLSPEYAHTNLSAVMRLPFSLAVSAYKYAGSGLLSYTRPQTHYIAAHSAIFSTPRLYRSSTMVPSTHIAAVINEKGDVELKKVAVPKAGENEVLVKVAAAALNPADCACHMSGILYV